MACLWQQVSKGWKRIFTFQRATSAVVWVSVVLLTTALLSASATEQSKEDETLCRESQPASAIPACNRLIENGASGSVLFDAYLHRGNAYFTNREHKKAIVDYTEAITRFPYTASYFNRAAVFVEIGEFDRAIADYNHVISESPVSAVVFHARGRALEANGVIDLAIADYKKALELDPSDPVAAAGLERLLP